MPANIEIKARVQNLYDLKRIAADMTMTNDFLFLKQTDIFYQTITGCRLKLRIEEDLKTSDTVTSQLIAYQRSDTIGPKYSYYEITEVTEPTTMESVLKFSNLEVGRVEKYRDVYIVTRNGLTARVHLDCVTDLGDFLEFEIILNNDSQVDEAKVFANQLSLEFGIEERDHIAVAYIDMVEERQNIPVLGDAEEEEEPTSTNRATITTV